ncbi:MAG: ABC transporter ATP-binding protein [Ignavibacteria bacterium]|nr:ABC transporter ATP-binding protein [Ignavibacteria bacterium]
MIIAENLVKVYSGDVKALDGISFHIEPGEVCGYLGSNGAGKSTTIRILCGMLEATSGNVIINGFNVNDDPTMVKKMIGYVPETGALFLSLTPFDFLEFVCRMYDMPKDVYVQRIYAFMELFDLKNEINTPMHAFSKGMRQKVLIISSLIHDPEVIVWDEPLSGIDYDTTLTIRNLVKDLRQRGKTFFYSTHIVESAEKICTRVIILNKGKIAFEGSVHEDSPAELEQLMGKYSVMPGVNEKITGIFGNNKQ